MKNSSPFLYLFLLLFISFASSIIHSQDIPICTSFGAQSFPAIVNDNIGGAIIVWSDQRSGNYDIYAQRINSSGETIWSANGIVICDAADYQGHIKVIPDSFGGAIIVWEDFRSGSYNIYAQRINSNGLAVWQPNGLLVSNSTSSRSPSICSDGNGGVIIAWEDKRNSLLSDIDIYAQRLNSSGEILWQENGIAICDNQYTQSSINITADLNGGSIIKWIDSRTWMLNTSSSFAQKIKSDGSLVWSHNGILLSNVSSSSNNILSDYKGGFFYLDNSSHLYNIDSNANISWSFDLGLSYNIPFNTFMLAHSSEDGIIASSNTHAQLVNTLGQSQWCPLGVNFNSINDQCSIIGDDNGGAIFLMNNSTSGNNKLYMQKINKSGLLQWQYNGFQISNSNSNQVNPALTKTVDGGLFIVWADDRNGNWDIYAQLNDGKGNNSFFSHSSPKLIAPANNSINQPKISELKWSKVFNAQFYLIQFSFSDSLFSDNLPAYSKTDTTGWWSFPYYSKVYWHVKWGNTCDTSNWSNTWSFQIENSNPPIPESPVLISPQNNNVDVSLSPSFKWSPVDNTKFYNLQVATDPAFSSNLLSTYSNDTSAVMFLSPNTSYYWRVNATNNFDNVSYWSQKWQFSTGSKPNCVSDFVVISDTLFNELYWTDNANNESGFILERKLAPLDSISQWSLIDTLLLNSNYYIDSLLLPATTYSYRISTFNSFGLSICDSVESITFVPVELLFFNSTLNDGTVSLKWATVSETNNHGFEIQRKIINNASLTQWEVLGFVPGNGTSLVYTEYEFIDNYKMPGKLMYRLKQLDLDGTYKYSSIATIEIPFSCYEYTLYTNYPNPFNPTTLIKYSLPETAVISISVHNILGQKVATLIGNELKEPGLYSVVFDASSLPCGIYFYSISTAKFQQTKKMLLIK